MPLVEETTVEGDVLGDFILKHCQPFLKLKPDPLKDPKLFRGMESGYMYPTVVDVRQDRKPRDMSVEIQNGIDAELKKRGFVARRGNSIFCTGNFNFALQYGKPYLVFPIGEFSYTWSRSVQDLIKQQKSFLSDYGLTTKTGKSFVPGFGAVNKALADRDGINGDFKRIVDDIEYQTSNFHDALVSGNEILINCQQVLYVPYMEPEYRKIIAEITR